MAKRLGRPETGQATRAAIAKTGRTRRSRALRKALGPTEDQLHRSVAEFLDWTLSPRVFWTTFPAGWGKLSKSLSGRLNASGLKPGVPDILILDEGIAFFIELKIPGKLPTIVQENTHKLLANAGARVAVCTSIDEVDIILNLWGVTRRASITLADQATKAGLAQESAQSETQAP